MQHRRRGDCDEISPKMCSSRGATKKQAVWPVVLLHHKSAETSSSWLSHGEGGGGARGG
jgi:hypothetical protein